MAKELLEEGKTPQVILGPMFYLEEELINKKIFERFKGWIMKQSKDSYSIDLFEFLVKSWPFNWKEQYLRD